MTEQNFSWTQAKEEGFFEKPAGTFILMFESVRRVSGDNGVSIVINTRIIDNEQNDARFIGQQVPMWYNSYNMDDLEPDMETLGMPLDEVDDPNVFAGEVFFNCEITRNEKNPKFATYKVISRLSDDQVAMLGLIETNF